MKIILFVRLHMSRFTSVFTLLALRNLPLFSLRKIQIPQLTGFLGKINCDGNENYKE
jgi:hypothetical protein